MNGVLQGCAFKWLVPAEGVPFSTQYSIWTPFLGIVQLHAPISYEILIKIKKQKVFADITVLKLLICIYIFLNKIKIWRGVLRTKNSLFLKMGVVYLHQNYLPLKYLVKFCRYLWHVPNMSNLVTFFQKNMHNWNFIYIHELIYFMMNMLSSLINNT